MLFPPPGICSPQIRMRPLTPCLQLKSHLVREVFPKQYIHKAALTPISVTVLAYLHLHYEACGVLLICLSSIG